MNDDELLLRDKGFGFLGSITASVSHEINNVFAIINELSGLLDDFFVASAHGAPLDLEKLRGTTKRISAQVDRGQKYVTRLNSFAHTVDDETGTIGFNETVEAITVLCRRFGLLLRVEIKTTLPAESPPVNCNSFSLQHVVFRCIELLLKLSSQGDVVEVIADSNNDSTTLIFSNGSSDIENLTKLSSELDTISSLVGAMQCKFESEIETGKPVRLTVVLPHAAK